MTLSTFCNWWVTNAFALALLVLWIGWRQRRKSYVASTVACNHGRRPCRSWCQLGQLPLLQTACEQNQTPACVVSTEQTPACPRRESQDQAWSGLNSIGFVTRQGFLSQSELLELSHSLDLASRTISDSADGKDIAVTDIPELVYSKVLALAKEASAAVGIADAIVDSASLFIVDPNDRRRNQHRLHQDHTSYFWGEDHIRYLNLYLAIDKAEEDANLDVIQFDQLRRCGEDLLAIQENGGAVRFMHRHESIRHFSVASSAAETILIDDNHGCNLAIDFPLESLACSPALRSGDMLVMRGDIIHRTGFFKQRRVALSLRFRDGALVIRAEQLLSMGLIKARYIRNMIGDYANLLGYLAAHKMEGISFADLRQEPYESFSRCHGIFSADRCRTHMWAFVWTWYYNGYLYWRAWWLELEAKLFPAY